MPCGARQFENYVDGRKIANCIDIRTCLEVALQIPHEHASQDHQDRQFRRGHPAQGAACASRRVGGGYAFGRRHAARVRTVGGEGQGGSASLMSRAK